MEKYAKIAIVGALVIVVGVVFALRQNRDPADQHLQHQAEQPAQSQGGQEASASPPASQPQPARAGHAPDAVSTQRPPERLPRLVDLGADKCIPCKMMAPILKELKKDYAGQLAVEFIDVWKNRGAGRQYGVRFIPTQIFYDKSGEELFRHEGFYSKEDILKKCEELGFELQKPERAN